MIILCKWERAVLSHTNWPRHCKWSLLSEQMTGPCVLCHGRLWGGGQSLPWTAGCGSRALLPDQTQMLKWLLSLATHKDNRHSIQVIGNWQKLQIHDKMIMMKIHTESFMFSAKQKQNQMEFWNELSLSSAVWVDHDSSVLEVVNKDFFGTKSFQESVFKPATSWPRTSKASL